MMDTVPPIVSTLQHLVSTLQHLAETDKMLVHAITELTALVQDLDRRLKRVENLIMLQVEPQ